ncbi:MAG: pyrimidine/purine nucleoside phosphorylase [Pseudomonadales bacterium]|nr:pyrimidine/purine nucleoside phosphorylase [Pseudomonadales bacterium]MDG2077988.1 pyrimidine/purine nucleoside phosphorylase [Pseudomonadales bacterium]
MSEFNQVSIVKAANIYFDGNVISRTVNFEDGSRKTLGFMQAGEYQFGTEQAEIMEVLGGSARVLLAGQDDWQTYATGSSFDVPANSTFELKVDEYMDYCCSYI